MMRQPCVTLGGFIASLQNSCTFAVLIIIETR